MAGKWHCMLTAFVCMGALGMAIMPVASANNTDGESQDKTTKTSVELRWFNPTVRGSVGGDSYFSQRSYEHKLDLEQDLGLDSMKAPEVKLTHGNWSVDYIRLSGEVEGHKLVAPISHGSKRYKGDLDTDIKMDYVSVDYHQSMAKNDYADVYWSAGAKYINVSATCTGINTRDERESDSDSAKGLVPSIGLGGIWKSATAPKWQGNVNISGMPLGHYGHILDLEAGFSYNPDANWKIAAGYRLLDMKLHKDDKEINLQANGPFLGVSYSF